MFSRLLLYASMAFADDPNVFPLGKVGEKELKAIVPGDHAILVIMVCLQIIWALYTEIKKQREKRENKDSEKLDRLYEMVHSMQGQMKELGAAPTETEIIMGLQPHIKVAVMEAVLKYGDK